MSFQKLDKNKVQSVILKTNTMLNNATFSSPESAFYEYQIKMENQLCQVCNCLAAGFHHGAYVCEACKKFFKRYSTNQLNSKVVCKKNCDLEKIGRRKCSFCRYQKCLNVGMKFFGLRSNKSNIDISQIPCRVCGGKSSGFHFGSLTCEGCKGFFRRAEPLKDKLECVSGKLNCVIDSSHKMPCKWCRYHRCIKVGMSKIGSRIGRQPNAVKHHCALEIIHYQNRNSSPSTLDIPYHEISSRISESNSDGNQRPISYSIPSTPVPSEWSMSFSSSPDGHSQAFCSKLIEAIKILQKPLLEAEKLFHMTRFPVHRNQSLLEVWNSMMRHFDVHTCILVYFAKKVPGFNDLSLSDKRTMVQDAMYSIMLLNLARSYEEDKDEFFNYFDFSKDEYEVILFHFPEMKKILAHVMEISRIIYKLNITKDQIGLLCIIELSKNYINLESFDAVRTIHKEVVRLFWISILKELDNEALLTEPGNPPSLPQMSVLLQVLNCPDDLISQIVFKIPKCTENKWCQKLHIIFKVLGEKLQEFNIEHQMIIDELKRNKPELPYPELYTEMFQLTAF